MRHLSQNTRDRCRMSSPKTGVGPGLEGTGGIQMREKELLLQVRECGGRLAGARAARRTGTAR
ncbi:hypothetical protein SBA4_7120015 [Candidatus Sulfopaludibacter sp. SbA4]|nr:hypothetical protein SBA4_7120015 [Candidatus Sulfopaludibacter sp. SbA4]